MSQDPESNGFLICRRIHNKVQYILFNIGEPPTSKIRENSGPALVLASALMGKLPFTVDFLWFYLC